MLFEVIELEIYIKIYDFINYALSSSPFRIIVTQVSHSDCTQWVLEPLPM